MKNFLLRFTLSVSSLLTIGAIYTASAESLSYKGDIPVVERVDTKADLASIRYPVGGVFYETVGDATKSDGAGGLFTFNKGAKAAATQSPDEFEVAPTGLFVRYVNETTPVRAEWFGAKVNDRVDDAPAIQKALDRYGRVDLLAGVYGFGKGLAVRDGAAYQKLENQLAAIRLKQGDRIRGAGKLRTVIRLLDGTNPRPANGNYVLLGGDRYVGTDRVQISDLTIDVNFDGQYKGKKDCPDDKVTGSDGKVYHLSNDSNDVATINAIQLFGEDIHVERLKVVGYASNTYNENFVIALSAPLLKKGATSPRCGTVRDVEMTNPGSNLSIKYGRFGKEALATNPYVQHIAEITHIVVGGYPNFDNGPFRADKLVLPVAEKWNAGYEISVKLNSLEALLHYTPDYRRNSFFVITEPVDEQLEWVPDSVERDDNLFVYDPNRTPMKINKGRFHLLPRSARVAGRAGESSPLLASPQELTPQSKKLNSADWSRNFTVSVRSTGPAYYFYEYNSKKKADNVRYFESKMIPGLIFDRRTIANPQCGTWNCDPAWDPSYLGENINNITMCKGGIIENNWIHDETTNPEGYDEQGVRFGLPITARANASNLHAITASCTDGLTIRNNRVTNFEGTAVFIMSWWNKDLLIENNSFDGVYHGLDLFTLYTSEGKPVQYPRHEGYVFRNNTITLLPYTRAPRGYSTAGVRFYNNIPRETTPGPRQYPGAVPEAVYPRMSNIAIHGNIIRGRSYVTNDPERPRVYPAGITMQNPSIMRDIRVYKNIIDIDSKPVTYNKIGGTGGITPKTTTLFYFPAEGYNSDAWQGVSFWDNYRVIFVRKSYGYTVEFEKIFPLIQAWDMMTFDIGAERKGRVDATPSR